MKDKDVPSGGAGAQIASGGRPEPVVGLAHDPLRRVTGGGDVRRARRAVVGHHHVEPSSG